MTWGAQQRAQSANPSILQLLFPNSGSSKMYRTTDPVQEAGTIGVEMHWREDPTILQNHDQLPLPQISTDQARNRKRLGRTLDGLYCKIRDLYDLKWWSYDLGSTAESPVSKSLNTPPPASKLRERLDIPYYKPCASSEPHWS